MFLPVAPVQKLRVAIHTAGAQARYGWFVKRPPKKFFNKLHTIFARIAGEHSSASPHLRRIFRGHNTDMWFMSGADHVSAAYRATVVSGKPPVRWSSKGPRARCSKQFFTDLQWSINGPWLFQHDELNFLVSLHPDRPGFVDNQGALDHMLRESWRCMFYNQWLDSGRRDAQKCQSVAYSSSRCAAARKYAHNTGARNIMSGGFVSPMAFYIITRDSARPSLASRPARTAALMKARPNCPLCLFPDGNLEHCLWRCPARDKFVYPVPKPKRPLQARLVWPLHDNNDEDRSIINMCCQIRPYMLSHRWK